MYVCMYLSPPVGKFPNLELLLGILFPKMSLIQVLELEFVQKLTISSGKLGLKIHKPKRLQRGKVLTHLNL